MNQPNHVVYISGQVINDPRVNGNAAYGVWWLNNPQSNFAKILQDDENLNQTMLEAVLAAILQARRKSYTNITIKTCSEFIVSRFENRNDRQRNGDEYSMDSRNEATINEIFREMEHVTVEFNLVPEDETEEAKQLIFEVRIIKFFSNNLQQL